MKVTRLLIFFCIVCCTKEEPALNVLLEKSNRESKVWRNPFASDQRVTHFDSLILQSSGQTETFFHVLAKTNSLMEAGSFEEAIQTISPWVKDSTNLEVLKVLSLANLRMGEIQNCLEGHNAESCILPIKGIGIHQDVAWSQSSIKLLEKILSKNPYDRQIKWLLNIAYMTLGKYPGGVPSQFLLKGLDNTAATDLIPFTDVAGQLGIAVNNMAGGSIVDDFNNDGYLDIVTSAWGLTESMHYFQNDGRGSFLDLSTKSNLAEIKGGLNIIQADYDNDGNIDILVLRGAWYGPYGDQPNSLLKNNGDGTFSDVTIESGMLSFHPTQTATWADFNNDGWLDLFIGNESVEGAKVNHPSELFINKKDGTFSELAEQAGVKVNAFVKGVTAGDFNRDGKMDIYLSTMNERDYLFKNVSSDGNTKFEDVTELTGLTDKTATFATWFFDFNNDGWQDIITCNYDFKASLSTYLGAYYENIDLNNEGIIHIYQNVQGKFLNVTDSIGIDIPVFAMGANFGDIDNDGYPDMMFGTGNPNFESLIPNRLFKNENGKKFADVTVATRVGHLQKGHAISFADVDNDGDQDIYAEMGGAYPGDTYPNAFYLNNNVSNNWVCIKLIGKKSNASAIGARIKVTIVEDGTPRDIYKWVNSGGSFGASPLRAEIGIGRARLINKVEIVWPSGETQLFNDLIPNTFYELKEGEQNFKKVILNPISWQLLETICL